MKIKLAYTSISLQIHIFAYHCRFIYLHIIVSRAYEHAMHGFLVACLLACLCLLVRLLLNYFLLLYSAGRDVRGLPEISPFVKNVVAIDKNCSRTQI